MSALQQFIDRSLISRRRLMPARDFYSPSPAGLPAQSALARWAQRASEQSALVVSRELTGLSESELNELEAKLTWEKSPKGESLFKRLEKQTLILDGEEVTIDNGQESALLSRHRVVRCLPNPDQVRRGEKDPQTVLEGISFLGTVQSTPDRRFVRLKLTEKVTELQRIEKLKV